MPVWVGSVACVVRSVAYVVSQLWERVLAEGQRGTGGIQYCWEGERSDRGKEEVVSGEGEGRGQQTWGRSFGRVG